MKASKKPAARAGLPKHEIVTLPLTALAPAPYNPRQISRTAFAGLSTSIERFGLVQPIVVNKRTGNRVVGGHQRVAALQQRGETEAICIVVDIDEAEEQVLNVTLNNPFIAGEFTGELQAILDQIKTTHPDLMNDLLLRDLLQNLASGGGSGDPDSVPPVPKTPVSKPGDLWRLGDHLVLCGDSTKPESYDRLMGDANAAMIFTDPPWNVAIGKDSNPKHRQREGLKNDDLGEKFKPFLEAWARACIPRLRGDLYCVMGSREWPAIDSALRQAGMYWSGVIVWVKDSFVLSRRNYHPRFEPIWYGWPAKRRSSFEGARDQDDVWEVPRPKASEEHPTMKPVELVERAILASSKRTDVVLEPFGGSGSTLIACERTNRRCVAIELDPRFVDVIVERWQNVTGRRAERARSET